MTNADRIRKMTDDQLVSLLAQGYEPTIGYVPSCDENCKYFYSGCILDCPNDRIEKSMREWLGKEHD